VSENTLVDAFRKTLWALYIFGACFLNSSACGFERPAAPRLTGASKSMSLTIPEGDRDNAAPRAGFEIAQGSFAPTITSLSPSSGPIGTLVTIRGSRFTATNFIKFRGAKAAFDAGSPVASESGAALQFQVNPCSSSQPLCPTFYVSPGEYRVVVTNENGTSNETRFVITPL